MVRRTVDRTTGVVMSEDVVCSTSIHQLSRSFQGQCPKEILTVFFSWVDDPQEVQLYQTTKTSMSQFPKDCYKSTLRIKHLCQGLRTERLLEKGCAPSRMEPIPPMQPVESQTACDKYHIIRQTSCVIDWLQLCRWVLHTWQSQW